MSSSGSIEQIRALIPRPLYPAARRIYRLASNQYYRVRLAQLKGLLRERYGDAFVTAIHPDDEMLRYPRDSMGMVHHRAEMRYFTIGETILKDLCRILEDIGFEITEETRALEFACGYGKVTRFLVTRIDPRQMTVADIDRQAVDFNSTTFGTSGFYSVADPNTLEHSETYDLIVVVSLFSHLPQSRWEAWLRRLYGMLRRGGVLIFSTHDTSIYESIAPERRKRLTTAAVPGFYYLEANETFGRLAFNEYGATYVSDCFISEFIRKNDLGHLRKSYPKAIDSFQDAHVIQRP